MPQPHYPTAEEVKRLLDSAEIKSFEQTVADDLNLPLLKDSTINIPDIQRKLYLANLTAESALNIVKSERESLLEWNAFLNQQEDEHLDGEIPEGEELGPDDGSIIIGEPSGMGQSFSVEQICFYWLASQKKSDVLLTFLERTRMPYRKKVCSDFRKFYSSS